MIKSMTHLTNRKVIKKEIDFPVRSGRRKVILRELPQEAEGNNQSFQNKLPQRNVSSREERKCPYALFK